MLLGYQGVNCELMSIPRLIYIRVQNVVPIGPAVWHISHIVLMCDPNPLQIIIGSREVNLFSRCPFPDESACVCHFGPDRFSGLQQEFGDC